MQSHASRHVASEFLVDRHPDLSPPFPAGVIKDEIAEAYGRRSVRKLIDVLSLPAAELSDNERAHALRVLLGMMTTQEQKLDAISESACATLTVLVDGYLHAEVLQLSCNALDSLAQVRQGRVAIVECGGIVALNAALETSPLAAGGALRTFTGSADGVKLLGSFLEPVVPSLATMVDRQPADEQGMRACINAVEAMARLSSTDEGILSCLEHLVPQCLVRLAHRCLVGDYKFQKDLNACYEAVAGCMEQIAHHNYGKNALLEAGAIPVIGGMLDAARFHPETVRKASAALMSVSVDKECKLPIIESCGSTLVRLLRSSDAAYAANARATLVSCAEHLPARSAITALVSIADQEALLFRGPLPPAPPDFRYKVTLPYKTGDEAVA
mmetsp:Transcript_2893/g.7784  ORF Transcript_2893/g.7784 Transcript_2893/m.7784 type:complete len:385 (-) Transcript_2893:448-1602(-)